MRGEGVREGNVLIYLSVALSSSPTSWCKTVYEGDFAGGSAAARNICCCHGREASCSDSFHSFPPFRKDIRPVPARIFMGRPRLELEFL